jgi:hypothetical protein
MTEQQEHGNPQNDYSSNDLTAIAIATLGGCAILGAAFGLGYWLRNSENNHLHGVAPLNNGDMMTGKAESMISLSPEMQSTINQVVRRWTVEGISYD